MARYEQQPWGEHRADQRVAASVLNLLAPYMKEWHEPPLLFFPYTDDGITLDVESTTEGLTALENIYDG